MSNRFPSGTAPILFFQQGEERGFDFFFRTHYAALTLFAYKITGQKEAAEEIAEDAFLTAWQKHASFSHPAVLKSFLYTAVKFGSLNWLRRQRKECLETRQLALLSNPAEDPVPYEIVSAEIHQQVFAAINQLPPKCRRIFQMLYIEGKDFQQIAAELQLSVSTIHNQKARGIRLLRERVNPGFISFFLFFLIIF